MPFSRAMRRLEADQLAGLRDIGEAPRHGVHRARLLVQRYELRMAHDAAKEASEVEQRGLRPAADIQRDVARRRDGREDVGARHVAHMDHVHGLQAVAEDDRRLAAREAFHPTHQDLGVAAVDVHARAIDVEVAQRDVVQPVHIVEGAVEPLVEGLGRAVERAVVVGMLCLGGGELVRHAIDRGGGGGDQLSDVRGEAQFHEIIGRRDHHLEGGAWFLRALRDAQRGLVEDGIAASDERLHRRRVPDIALDQAHSVAGERAGEVVAPPTHHVVDDAHLRRTGVQQQLDDMRADEACAAGDEAGGAGKHALRVEGFAGFTRHDWSPRQGRGGRAARRRCGAAARG